MKIALSDHFSFSRLLRFTLPSIIMMIFTSVYGVVDGFFVSNFVGKTPFAAVNLIMPFLMILGAVGFMFGAGGSALVARTLGEREPQKANQYFSLFVYATIFCGIVMAAFGILTIRPIARLLGADSNMLEHCVLYGRIILAALPFYMLQFEFQSFFIAAQKPQLGLAVTLIAGISNMVFDALFVAIFRWGLVGAAAATAISQILGGLIPLIYFARPNTSLLKLTKTRLDWYALLKACSNGASELMSNISMSIVGMLYNFQLMKYAGENGIAAYGVLMYVNMIFIAVFIGYSTGIAPVISYHFGAGHPDELKSLLRKSSLILAISSILMFACGELLARPLSAIFVGYDSELLALTARGFLIYSFSFLFAGISIFGSAFFTALNDGLTSALISFLRTLVFQVAAVLIFPFFMGIDGIWLSIVAAELMAMLVAIGFIALKHAKYHY